MLYLQACGIIHKILKKILIDYISDERKWIICGKRLASESGDGSG